MSIFFLGFITQIRSVGCPLWECTSRGGTLFVQQTRQGALPLSSATRRVTLSHLTFPPASPTAKQRVRPAQHGI